MEKPTFYMKRDVKGILYVFPFIITIIFIFFGIAVNAQTPSRAKLSVLLLLNLNGGSHNTADGVVAVFADNFSTSIGNEDSYKFTNLDENLAINRNGTSLSIEGRPNITATDTLPFRMWKFRQKSYYFKLVGSNFSPSLTAVVKDTYLKQDFPISLTDTTIIAFNITSDSASFASNRFYVVFKDATTLPIMLSDFNADTKDKGVQISWVSATESDISMYEIEKSVNGVDFIKAAAIASKSNIAVAVHYSWFDAATKAGNNYYRIKTVKKSGTFELSAVRFVNIYKKSADVTIYPNPVKGNLLGLQFNNEQSGRYQVNLYNLQGQKIFTTQVEYNGSLSTQNLSVGKQPIKGIYTLQLINGISVINKRVLFQ